MQAFARTAAFRRTARAAAPLLPVAELPESEGDTPAGPGWYESSWDLRHGLEVCEAPWSEAMAGWPA